MMKAKKANATLAKGTPISSVRHMKSAKVTARPSFTTGTKEGKKGAFTTVQNGHKGANLKYDD